MLRKIILGYSGSFRLSLQARRRDRHGNIDIDCLGMAVYFADLILGIPLEIVVLMVKVVSCQRGDLDLFTIKLDPEQ